MNEHLWQILAGATAILTGIVGWMWVNMIGRLSNLEKEGADCKLNLANHALEAERTYAKEVNVQAALARVHNTMEKNFSEMRGDIKELIRVVGGKS